MTDKNNEHNLTPEQEKELFSNLELSYSRSKSDVWDALQDKIDAQTPATAKPTKNRGIGKRRQLTYLSAAASLVLVLGLGLFARFYTTQVSAAVGELTSHTLPDGSIIHLNAASTIAYAPYWWRFGRKVNLEGEAFFEVQKGKKFSVHSRLGTTQVLGTSFNILARGNAYEVLCKTGKVRVSNRQSNQVILNPGEYAKLQASELVKQTDAQSKKTMLAWRLNKFMYNNTPLTKVFADIERHYNVKIDLSKVKEHHYTGLFKRSVPVEKALQIICYSFELNFKKQSEGEYVVF
ncbi:FecR family protein [Microscilla marina]|uniref:Putative anti-sigma factor n=1 Tax=Microscilla marina ATCC 23134 TaxID=313606 RepID=A1ZFC8_MICM2|nr:FecR family protein [Microscilla marina]EAY30702.1 putative anti-sigma factor [Microscilla marina ATCC 23134]